MSSMFYVKRACVNITLSSMLETEPWPLYAWQHTTFQLSSTLNRDKRAFCRLTCDYLTKSVCQSCFIECFENMGAISTVYALCVWNIKMSNECQISCILLWKYGIFSKHFRLHLKIDWISKYLMIQIKSCIDPRESRFRSSVNLCMTLIWFCLITDYCIRTALN